MAYSLERTMSREEIAAFCRRNHIQRLSLFGSAIRGPLRPDGDTDLLVEFEQDCTPGLFSMVRMEMELSAALGRRVDMRPPEDLSPYFRDEVTDYAKLQYPV